MRCGKWDMSEERMRPRAARAGQSAARMPAVEAMTSRIFFSSAS